MLFIFRPCRPCVPTCEGTGRGLQLGPTWPVADQRAARPPVLKHRAEPPRCRGLSRTESSGRMRASVGRPALPAVGSCPMGPTVEIPQSERPQPNSTQFYLDPGPPSSLGSHPPLPACPRWP